MSPGCESPKGLRPTALTHRIPQRDLDHPTSGRIKKHPLAVALFAALTLAIPSPARPGVASTTTGETLDRLEISGLLFGDAYWVASQHETENEGIVSAWIRRGYLTFDSELTHRLTGRLRFELNQSGEFDVFTFDVDIKDLYLETALGRQRVLLGLSPTPTFNLIETFWGYRHIEKTPLDLQGIASRDTGIAASGPLDERGRLTYRAMYGSELEFGADGNDSSKWMGAVSFEPDDRWVVELYADYESLPDGKQDRHLYQGFIGYRRDDARFGLQYADQDRGSDPGIQLASVFGIVDLTERWSAIARIDRLFEPSVKGNDIAYLPFDPDADATLLILGVEVRPCKSFSLAPNIEAIRYDDPPGPEPPPTDDLLVRLTLYWTF